MTDGKQKLKEYLIEMTECINAMTKYFKKKSDMYYFVPKTNKEFLEKAEFLIWEIIQQIESFNKMSLKESYQSQKKKEEIQSQSVSNIEKLISLLQEVYQYGSIDSKDIEDFNLYMNHAQRVTKIFEENDTRNDDLKSQFRSKIKEFEDLIQANSSVPISKVFS